MTDDLEQKEKYAWNLLFQPNNPFAAAQAVFGANVGMCLKASQEWVTDPDVLRFKEQFIKEHGAQAFLPSKETAARDIYENAQKALTAGIVREYRQLMELYVTMMGFIKKDGADVNVGITVPSVMLVKDTGNEDDWEAKLAANQRALTESTEDA